MSNLPLQPTETVLEPAPPDAEADLDDALATDATATPGRLRAVAAANPAFLAAWAALAEHALDTDDPVAAYAFARTGYHRGLDAVRRAGWRGQGAVPWRHAPNRGFLRAVHALMRAAAAIGEAEEEERCRAFLRELDPDDGLGIGARDTGEPPGGDAGA